MFCENCGKPIDEGKHLCDQCAAQAPAEEIAAPVPAEETFQLSSLMDAPPEASKPKEKKPRKKLGKKGKLILLSSLALVLVAAIVVVICCWSQIRLFWKRTFTDPTEYLVSVEEAAGDRQAKAVADAYGRLRDDLVKKDRGAHVELTLSADDQVMMLLDQFLGGQIELSWINDLALTLDTNAMGGLSENELALSLNGTHLLTLELFTSQDALWLQLPELSEEPLTGEAPELPMHLEDLPSADQVEAMVKKFQAIPRSYLKDAQKGEETLKAGKLEQELWVLSAELTEKEYLQLRKELVTELQKDATAKQLLTALGGQELYEEFQAKLDETLTALEAEEATGKKAMTYRVYLDQNDQIVGRSLTPADKDLGDLHCYYLTADDRWGLDLTAGTLCITGDGKVKEQAYSGSITVKNDESTLLSLDFTDFTSSDDGSCSGTLLFQPGKKLLTAIGNELGLDESVMRLLGTSLSLELTLEVKQDSFACSFSAKAMGITLVEAALTSRDVKPTAVTLPEGGVDLTDADALADWATELELSGLVDALEDSGMPAKYITALRLLLSQLG